MHAIVTGLNCDIADALQVVPEGDAAPIAEEPSDRCELIVVGMIGTDERESVLLHRT